MAGQIYYAVLDGTSVSAICDLFYIKPPSSRAVVIHEVVVTQETSETSEQLPLKLFRTATDNSAQGSANTPAKGSPGFASAASTVRTVITGGNLATETEVLSVEGQNVLGGWAFLPTPEMRPVLAPGGNGFVVKLKTAPTGAIPISGRMVFEEIG
jgi:hypothetical protein